MKNKIWFSYDAGSYESCHTIHLHCEKQKRRSAAQTSKHADQALVTRRLDTLNTVSFNPEISRLYPTKIKVNVQDFALMNIHTV